MKTEHDESTKIILGLLIGGVVGAGVLYCVHAAQNQKTPFLKKIGRTVSEMGEMIENCNLCKGSGVMDSIEKNIPKGTDIVNSLTDWVDAGMSLWKKFKKG